LKYADTLLAQEFYRYPTANGPSKAQYQENFKEPQPAVPPENRRWPTAEQQAVQTNIVLRKKFRFRANIPHYLCDFYTYLANSA
jgi:hypothetical protein